MAGMSDASTPLAGMPLPPSLLPGTSYMRGPGVDTSGAAIQLPATAPIGPTATARAIGAAVQRPDLPVVQSAMGGGMPGPTMTPQGLVAAKQASADALGLGNLNHLVLGDGGVAAQQQMRQDFAAGQVAAGVGDFARGTAIGAGRLIAAPFAGAMGIGAATYDNAIVPAARAVGTFAQHLFGIQPGAAPASAPAPAALPVQVAAPPAATVPTALGAMGGLTAGPRPGVAQFRQPNGQIGYVASTAFDGQPAAAAVPQPVAAQPVAAQPVVAQAGMPVVAQRAPLAQTQFERDNNIPAGGVMQAIAQAHPSQRGALIAQLAGARGPSEAATAQGLSRDTVLDTFNKQMAAAGNNADAVLAAKAEYRKNLLLVDNPTGYGAVALSGAGFGMPAVSK